MVKIEEKMGIFNLVSEISRYQVEEKLYGKFPYKIFLTRFILFELPFKYLNYYQNQLNK